jgi:hypothetical protein
MAFAISFVIDDLGETTGFPMMKPSPLLSTRFDTLVHPEIGNVLIGIIPLRIQVIENKPKIRPA